MRKACAALLGIVTAISIVPISATSASADDKDVYCYNYPIGRICVVLIKSGLRSIEGGYANTGASPHTGHIDLYVNSKLAWQGVGVTVKPNGTHTSQSIQVSQGDKVRADWVDKSGTHAKSPTKNMS